MTTETQVPWKRGLGAPGTPLAPNVGTIGDVGVSNNGGQNMEAKGAGKVGNTAQGAVQYVGKGHGGAEMQGDTATTGPRATKAGTTTTRRQVIPNVVAAAKAGGLFVGGGIV